MLYYLELLNLFDMRIDIFPNFLNEKEIALINTWVEFAFENKLLANGVDSKGNEVLTRFTSRRNSNKYNYPKAIDDLSERIVKFVGIQNYPVIKNHGNDGVVVNYTIDGGDIYKHKDQKSIEGFATLRCNILTQKSENGGDLYIEDNKIDIGVGDLHCYLASEHEHWVTKVEGNTPRIMWMFGAHVPAEDWNSGKIKHD